MWFLLSKVQEVTMHSRIQQRKEKATGGKQRVEDDERNVGLDSFQYCYQLVLLRAALYLRSWPSLFNSPSCCATGSGVICKFCPFSVSEDFNQ